MPIDISKAQRVGPEEDGWDTPEERPPVAPQPDSPEAPAAIPDALDEALKAFVARQGELTPADREKALDELIEATWRSLDGPGAAERAWAAHGLEWDRGYGWRAEVLADVSGQEASVEGNADRLSEGGWESVLARERLAQDEAAGLLSEMLPGDVLDRVQRRESEEAPGGGPVGAAELLAWMVSQPVAKISRRIERARFARAERALFAAAHAKESLLSGPVGHEGEERIEEMTRALRRAARDVRRLGGDPGRIGQWACDVAQHLSARAGENDWMEAVIRAAERMAREIVALVQRVTGKKTVGQTAQAAG